MIRKFPGISLNLRTFKDGAILARHAACVDASAVCDGVRWQGLDDDLISSYERDFGRYGTKASVGSVDLLEIRMNIARNPQYTKRCRVHPLFQDCFDENGDLYEGD